MKGTAHTPEPSVGSPTLRLAHAVVGLIALLLVGSTARASENTVMGFVVSKQQLAEALGSGDAALTKRVIKHHKRSLPWIQERFDYHAEYQEREPVSVRQALTEMIEGKPVATHRFEYQCATELLLRVLGRELNDDTKHGSLNTFMDLWLDGPSTVMEALGYTTLESIWIAERNPIPLPGEVDWPIVNYLNLEQLQQVEQQFAATPIHRVTKLADDLFDGRGDELSIDQLKTTHQQILRELQRWVRVALESNRRDPTVEHYLVLIFDGDL